MERQRESFIEKMVTRRARAFWSRAARNASKTEMSKLRQQRAAARVLRQKLDELIFVADDRLGLPRIGSNAFTKPAGTDWSWRPPLWRASSHDKGLAAVENGTKFSNEVTLFHDCAVSELTLRQLRNNRESDLAPYGLRMDVFRFDGSFLSLAVDLPSDACKGLLRRHLVRMEALIEVESDLEIFARLNVRHGPNTEQIVRELNWREGKIVVEFDLAYTHLNEKRVEAMWLDLIFEGPEMNQVTLRDLTFSRHPRAEL